MKKFIIALLLTAIISSLLLTACYVSNPAKMDELVGTYELTSYTRRPKNSDPEDENATVDMIKDKEITAYLVVKSDGYGYYVYKDKDTELTAYSVRITYTYDDEHPDQVKEIYYEDGYVTSGNNYPGRGRERLGLNFKKKDRRLTYSVPSSELMKRDYSQSVEYTKVDNANDLSFVNSKLNASLSASEYGLKGLEGLFVNSDIYGSETYVFMAVEFSKDLKTANYYYALKADEVLVKQSGLNVSTVYPEEDHNIVLITIGSQTFKRNLNALYPNVYTTVDQNEYYTLSSYYISEEDQDKTTEQILQPILDQYLEMKQYQ